MEISLPFNVRHVAHFEDPVPAAQRGRSTTRSSAARPFSVPDVPRDVSPASTCSSRSVFLTIPRADRADAILSIPPRSRRHRARRADVPRSRPMLSRPVSSAPRVDSTLRAQVPRYSRATTPPPPYELPFVEPRVAVGGAQEKDGRVDGPGLLTFVYAAERVFVDPGRTYDDVLDAIVDAFPALRRTRRRWIALHVLTAGPAYIRVPGGAWAGVLCELGKFDEVAVTVERGALGCLWDQMRWAAGWRKRKQG